MQSQHTLLIHPMTHPYRHTLSTPNFLSFSHTQMAVIETTRDNHPGGINIDQGLTSSGLGVVNSDKEAPPPALVPSLLSGDESVVCGCAITAVDMLVKLLQADPQETQNNNNNNNNNNIITPAFLLTTTRQISLTIRESSAYQKQLKQAKKHNKKGVTPSDNISPAGLLEGTPTCPFPHTPSSLHTLPYTPSFLYTLFIPTYSLDLTPHKHPFEQFLIAIYRLSDLFVTLTYPSFVLAQTSHPRSMYPSPNTLF